MAYLGYDMNADYSYVDERVQTPMTNAQAQMIRDAKNRPTAREVLTAGQKGNWIENQADVNQTTTELGGMFIGEGYNDRPTWTEESRLAGEALNRGLAKGREQKAAMDARDFEIERLRAVQTDPGGAELFARYKRGEIAGYEITSNPNVSPFWKRMVAEEPAEPLDPSRYGRAQLPGNSSRRGMKTDVLRSEAEGQIEKYVERLLKGRGNRRMQQSIREYMDSMVKLEDARASGEMTPQQIKELEADAKRLQTQTMDVLKPLLSRFEKRMGKEDAKGSVLGAESIANRAIVDMLNANRGRQASRQGAGQQPIGGPTSPRSRSSSRTQPTVSPSPPTIQYTAGNQPVAEYKNLDDAFASAETLAPGSAVKIGERVLMPVVDGGGMRLADAVSIGNYYVTDPRAFQGSTAEESAAMWGDTISDEERQDMLRHLIVEGGDRNLSNDMRRRIRQVYESRQNFNNVELSGADKKKALNELYDRENELLYDVAVSGVGNRQPQVFSPDPEETGSSGGSSGGSSKRPGKFDLPAGAVPEQGVLDSMIPGVSKEFDYGAMPTAWKLLNENQSMELEDKLNSISIRNPEVITTEMYDTLARAIVAAREADPEFSVIPILNEVLGGIGSNQSQPTESEPGGSGERAARKKTYTNLTERAREILSDPEADPRAREIAQGWLNKYPTFEAYREAMSEQTKD